MKKPDRKLITAIAGCGTVGSATAKILTNGDWSALRSRSNVSLELRYIVDIDFTTARKTGLDPKLFCESYDTVLQDDSIDAVVELVGGLTAAKDFILKALRSGKHVVTANKALMAESGIELMSEARENGVTISFEASCAGGVPIIHSLTNGLIADEISALYGILNGTCNYILTAMTHRGTSYREALKEAQKAGYAEADSTLDVSGFDTAHKLAILASLAFGGQIDMGSIPITGIDTLGEIDVAYGSELGYVVKLLAIAKRQESRKEEGLSLCVRPAFITKEHPLAWVSGPFNAVSVYGDSTGHTMYYGRGAGGSPTASAIVSDLYAIATGMAQSNFDHFLWPDRAAPAFQLPIEEIISRYYIRVMAEDRPGVLAQIASKLGNNNISILSVLQKELPEGSKPALGVPVVITTHRAQEGSMRKALDEIDNLDVVKGPSVCIEIVDEHLEQI
jgi:homoserine dehydrogenase